MGGKRIKSLRVKLVMAFVLVTAAILICTWILTKLLLPRVYLRTKINDLTSMFDAVSVLLSQDGEVTDDTVSSLQSLQSGKNISVLIMDASDRRGLYLRDPVYSTGSHKTRDRMLELELIKAKKDGYNFAAIHWDAELLTKNDRYEIYEMDWISNTSSQTTWGSEFDEEDDTTQNAGGTYIDLSGMATDRYYVYMSIDYESISKATDIATSFQLKAAIGILLVAAGLIFLLCRIITRPIEKMSQAAEKMCNLDFEARCPEDRDDEIGELGRSLNVLSEKLEKTIGDLKQANNELEHDIRKKEEIENMRSDFISNVSHELKTPIALIQGYAEGLQDNVNDDPENRNYYCDVIIDEAAKMNNIVRKLLSLNQLEYGEQSLEYDRFDIYDLLRGVLRDTEILQKQQDVTVHLYGEGPCYVWADEYRIEEVVTNYVSNAFHHVSKSREIAVSVKKTDATVRVSVYNTGEPIPEEDLDKVWIKFFKVDKARTREYGGSGIGLSVVKAVMDAHNRKCGVINHEGGVEFWFELDASDDASEKREDKA
ncbi:MAG: HAMP domain-containing protein [Lachnospiraceae bacterium]|nr:HAMP domain-containing protein [Lachnospiraceae bacterium]